MTELPQRAGTTQLVTTRPVFILDLQILRALAASLVVADHTFASLVSRGAAHGEGQLNFGFSGTAGVSAFFILSGLIMVRQSIYRFGTPGAAFDFMVRRIVRIMPMYWIATVLWLASLVRWKVQTAHAAAQLFCSLFFIPDFLSGQARFKPILQQGWTLNFEMFFYLLFAAALLLPRRFGVSLLLGLFPVLSALGFLHRAPATSWPTAMLRFYTDPILWLFACGVLIGFLEVKRKAIPQIKLPVSPAFLLLLPPLLFGAFPALSGRAVAISWVVLQIYCAGVVVACTLFVTGNPGRVSCVMALFGDASYSTYLFHLWACAWIIPPVARLYGWHEGHGMSAAPFVIAAIAVANLLGLGLHLVVERPLTRLLRSWTTASVSRSGMPRAALSPRRA